MRLFKRMQWQEWLLRKELRERTTNRLEANLDNLSRPSEPGDLVKANPNLLK